MLAYHEKCYGWAERVGIPVSMVVEARPVARHALATALSVLAEGGDAAMPSLPLDRAQALALRNWDWLTPSPGRAQ
jgi:hypothetical protein